MRGEPRSVGPFPHPGAQGRPFQGKQQLLLAAFVEQQLLASTRIKIAGHSSWEYALMSDNTSKSRSIIWKTKKNLFSTGIALHKITHEWKYREKTKRALAKVSNLKAIDANAMSSGLEAFYR